MMTEAEIRGQNARRAMEEFLAPAFDAVISTYMARLADIAAAEPWETGKIAKLAMAARVTKEVRTQIEAIVAAGDVARADRAHAEKIANIPDAKRRLLGL